MVSFERKCFCNPDIKSLYCVIFHAGSKISIYKFQVFFRYLEKKVSARQVKLTNLLTGAVSAQKWKLKKLNKNRFT